MIFHSSYTALLTPFKDKKVDYDGYRKLIDFQIENGIYRVNWRNIRQAGHSSA